MKKAIYVIVAIGTMLILLIGCGEKKTLICDGCGKEVSVQADSNMDDSWIIFCSQCEKELGLDSLD